MTEFPLWLATARRVRALETLNEVPGVGDQSFPAIPENRELTVGGFTFDWHGGGAGAYVWFIEIGFEYHLPAEYFAPLESVPSGEAVQ
ncbi:MAG: hypothetical protein H6873_05515 [Hyphomicrobiaceae bacterium]|nr:hypothetical protein [Hyphomicrobiaceae bacterium]